MGGERARIIAIVNEKGGVGKTVTTLNLGAALSLEGKSVLIVDADPQFNATTGLGVCVDENMPNVYDIVKDPAARLPGDAVVSTRWNGLDLIPSHIDLSGAEIELVDVPGRENRLKEGLAGIDRRYDFILVDTPPSLSLITVNVFAYAKELVVPCQTHPYSFSALDELFETIGSVRETINPEIAVTGIVATFFDGRTRVSRMVLEKLEGDDRFKDLLFETKIRVNTAIAESAAEGKPVVFYKKSSTGARDYTELAQELLTRGSG